MSAVVGLTKGIAVLATIELKVAQFEPFHTFRFLCEIFVIFLIYLGFTVLKTFMVQMCCLYHCFDPEMSNLFLTLYLLPFSS